MNALRTEVQLRAVAIGLGAREALRATAGSWTVSASFRKATYVSTPGWMFVVAARSVPRGPLYLTVDVGDVFSPPGTGVTVSGSSIFLGGTRIDGWRSADVWVGGTPDRLGLRRHRQMAIECLSSLAQRSALHTEPFSRPARLAMTALDQGQLTEVSRLLVGLGPGLTPAGDDALAGVFITARFLCNPQNDVLPLPGAGSTSSLSLGFIRWAMRGQAIAPIHAFLTAAAAGSELRCLAAVAQLARIGATSGADCAFGIAAALRTIGVSSSCGPVAAAAHTREVGTSQRRRLARSSTFRPRS